MQNYSAFTLKSSSGFLRVLKTSCGVCRAFEPSHGGEHPEVIEFVGIWDTGATGTVITKNVVDALLLKPIGKTRVYHADGNSIVNIYAINLFLPNKVAFPFVRVTEGNLNGADLLIGMDIITMGDFSITNTEANTTFSFRIPSIKEVDFVKEKEEHKINKPLTEKEGRNELCPCNSGKKYKNCHGK